MPEINGAVHHVNLSVSDLDRSARWYSELLGLEEVARLAAGDRAWSKVILRHRSGLLIGLTQHSRNRSEPFAEWRSGFDHVALCVDGPDELTSWVERLDEMHVEHSEVKTTPLGSLIVLRDPDNIQLELYAAGA